MKKLLLSIAMIAVGFTASAQDKDSNSQTEQGKWLIEANTNFGGGHAANTGIQFTSVDGNSNFNIGLEGGYFVADDLAVKLGLGYNDGLEAFSYKVGAKYYIESMIPVQLDLSGTSLDGANPMWLGIQGGYAIFLGENVSVEPGLRYNYGIGDAEDVNIFQLNIGFALHF